MTNLSALVSGPASAPPGLTTVVGTGAMKSSIVLFDTIPGTRNFIPTVSGNYRVAAVGGGSLFGGSYSENYFQLTAGTSYSYTVGVAGVNNTSAGGTSSFNAVISAPGGPSSGSSPSVGTGGKINTSGGGSGGASGHRFGNGAAGGGSGSTAAAGGGWSQSGCSGAGGNGGVDGFGLGLIPGLGAALSVAQNAGYGGGGISVSGGTASGNAGIGGGVAGSASTAATAGLAGVGGGNGLSGAPGGVGCIIVELIG